MAEGGFEEDDVFTHADDSSFSSLPISRHRSLAYELERATSDQRTQLIKDKVDSFYRSTGLSPDLVDPNNFRIDKDGHLFYIKEDNTQIQLTHRNDPSKYLSLATIRTKFGSVHDMRRHLSLSDYKPQLSSQAVSLLQETEKKLPADVEAIPLQDLSQTASDTINELETSFNDAIQTMDDPPLPMREIMALNESLKSVRGELVNNLAKLSALDDRIEYEKQKLADADDDPEIPRHVRDQIEQRLKDFRLERAARLEVLSSNRNQLRSQVSRIRETIQTILNEDTTLVERLKTLFREQGITIFSVLSAIGMAISTLVLAVTGGSGGATSPDNSGGDAKKWIKKQLHHLSELQKKLASKAIDALPGIIGSVVSWLLSMLGKVVGYMSEHLWTLLVLGAGLLLSQIQKQ